MKSILHFTLIFSLISFLLFSCSSPGNDVSDAENVIDSVDIKRYVTMLGSDEFQGRQPFTEGEEKTINYLKQEFERIGLKPGFNGSYFQDVPMVEITGKIPKIIKISSQKNNIELTHVDDFLTWSRHITDKVKLENSELVFAGYGIVAPEYDWNDYKGLDVKGKTVVVLVNDPGYNTTDSSFFKANTMTYYGRWTYKYEEAARQGAAGILIIHETGPAGYPFSVPAAGAGQSELYLKPKKNSPVRSKIEGWLTFTAAQKLFESAGYNFEELILSAKKKEFNGVSLNATLSIEIEQKVRYDNSKNVLGIIEGSERPDECIVYSAHWDHLGIGPVLNGDSIYNGAVDNGTSLAWMMEIAEAFMNLNQKPKRSILFFAPTAEETGLIGSRYYANNPVFETSKTVACINNDLMLPLGKMNDVMVTGYGQSELDNYVEEAAKLQNRYVLPDPSPETGMYFRSDHFSFAKVGVPSLFVRGNCDHAKNGKDWAHKKEKEWLANNYHKPTDEYDASWWDFTNIVDDAKLAFRIGFKLANENTFPKWNNNSEFKSIREKKIQ
ncbi:MAG: M28 family peptidase [Lentisphaerae bacterium]|nr:M28 family peptidase [Lentisphaerota bacterium]